MAKYYEIIKPRVEVLKERKGQVGKFVGYFGELVELLFGDGKKLYCFPDEVKML